MIKSALNCLKLAAVTGVLATVLVPFPQSSTAGNQPSPAAPADLVNEERVISRYCDDLFAYEKQAVELGKRGTLVAADLETLQRKSDDLKRRLSEVQNAVRETIKKLKAANEWDDLGRRVAARITDSRLKSYIEQDNVTRDLEDDAANLVGQASEINLPLDRLRKRLTSRLSSGADFQMVHAAYAAPLARKGLGCRMTILGIKIVIAVGKTPTPEQGDRVIKRCGFPDELLNPF